MCLMMNRNYPLQLKAFKPPLKPLTAYLIFLTCSYFFTFTLYPILHFRLAVFFEVDAFIPQNLILYMCSGCQFLLTFVLAIFCQALGHESNIDEINFVEYAVLTKLTSNPALYFLSIVVFCCFFLIVYVRLGYNAFPDENISLKTNLTNQYAKLYIFFRPMEILELSGYYFMSFLFFYNRILTHFLSIPAQYYAWKQLSR